MIWILLHNIPDYGLNREWMDSYLNSVCDVWVFFFWRAAFSPKPPSCTIRARSPAWTTSCPPSLQSWQVSHGMLVLLRYYFVDSSAGAWESRFDKKLCVCSPRGLSGLCSQSAWKCFQNDNVKSPNWIEIPCWLERTSGNVRTVFF